MKKLSFISTVLAVSLVMGCTNPNGTVSDAGVGTVLGGAAGALAGSAFGGGTGKLLMVGAGAVGGALVGNAVGSNMDKQNGNAQ